MADIDRYIECKDCGYKGVGYQSYISRTELSDFWCPECANKKITKNIDFKKPKKK